MNSKDNKSFDKKVEEYVYAYSSVWRSMLGNTVGENMINPDYIEKRANEYRTWLKDSRNRMSLLMETYSSIME